MQKGYKVGYARVSTDDQNLDLQIEALKRAGVRDDNIHTDVASTRSKKKREGLIAMWKDLRAGDTLVVWKMDRLGRDISELIQTIDELGKRGVELEVITERVDTATPHGRLFFHIIAAFAQYERDLIRERTKAGLAAAAAKGRKGGRRVRFTDELKTQAKRMLAEGQHPKAVAKALGFHPSLISKYRTELYAADVAEEIKADE